MASGQGSGGRQAWFELAPPAAWSWANSFLSLSLRFIAYKTGLVAERMIYIKQRLVRVSLVQWINDVQHCGQLKQAFSEALRGFAPCAPGTQTGPWDDARQRPPKGSFLAFKGANLNLVFSPFAINMNEKNQKALRYHFQIAGICVHGVGTSATFIN